MGSGSYGWHASRNHAFEDYKRATLERLEAERRKLAEEERAFADFLRELRNARDREEFDRFMQSRLEPVPGVAEGGRLFVRGPNVMLGYLRAEKPGVIEAPAEGWHDTGDIVAIDERGFIAIRGRAKRFAKIGGEMISLSAVEALAGELWPKAISAVIALPDPRKGERLTLATTQADATRETLFREARNKGASELMVPAEVLVLEKLPLLATGKTDYPALTELVKARTGKTATLAA